MFRHSDPRCRFQVNSECTKGVEYSFERKSRWHCGCCNAPFWLHLKAENISHYIILVEVGEKKVNKMMSIKNFLSEIAVKNDFDPDNLQFPDCELELACFALIFLRRSIFPLYVTGAAEGLD